MATPSTTHSGVGLRWVQIFALNATGSPNASGTAVYEGVQIEGAKALTLNAPESRTITHVGDDRVIAVDKLPPTDASSGELTTAKIDDDLEEILTNNNVITVGDGESKAILIATDNQGSEPQIGMLAYRQTLDTNKGSATYGKRLWEWYLIPKAFVIPKPPSFNENGVEVAYSLFPQIVGAHLWETAFTVAAENAVEAQFARGVSEYAPIIVAFKGDGATAAFTFHADRPAQATAKISAWKNGVLVTTGLTKATTGITFTAGTPANGDRVVVFYEKTSA